MKKQQIGMEPTRRTGKKQYFYTLSYPHLSAPHSAVSLGSYRDETCCVEPWNILSQQVFVFEFENNFYYPRSLS